VPMGTDDSMAGDIGAEGDVSGGGVSSTNLGLRGPVVMLGKSWANYAYKVAYSCALMGVLCRLLIKSSRLITFSCMHSLPASSCTGSCAWDLKGEGLCLCGLLNCHSHIREFCCSYHTALVRKRWHV